MQFHPEVLHTADGKKMLRNFVYNVCGFRRLECLWTPVENCGSAGAHRRRQGAAGPVRRRGQLRGGRAAKAVGEQLTCMFVDHGLLRKNEGETGCAGSARPPVRHQLCPRGRPERFFSKLAGVTEPERKRKIIGEEFIRVFEDEAKKIGAVDFLAQGTIYPDVVESGLGGESAHQEPPQRRRPAGLCGLQGDRGAAARLFKDEVRQLGRELGLPEYLVARQPFPGPGLAIRIIGDITEEKVDHRADADAIFREEMKRPAWTAASASTSPC